MKHIDENRMFDFANERHDFTLDEDIHLGECAVCWRRLILAIQLAVVSRTETKSQAVN